LRKDTLWSKIYKVSFFVMKLLPFLLFTLACLPVIVFGQTEEIATSSEGSAPVVEETAATTSAPTEIIPPVTASPAPVALEARTQERIINLAANISNRFNYWSS
jgi:hypothetical protein